MTVRCRQHHYVIHYDVFDFYTSFAEHNTHASEHDRGKLLANLMLLLSVGLANRRWVIIHLISTVIVANSDRLMYVRASFCSNMRQDEIMLNLKQPNMEHLRWLSVTTIKCKSKRLRLRESLGRKINYFLDENDKTKKLTIQRKEIQTETKRASQTEKVNSRWILHLPTHLRFNPTSLVYSNKLLPKNKFWFTARSCFFFTCG